MVNIFCTNYVGYIKGVGKIYQQTFVDTYSRVAIVKLYDQKTALTAADAMNDRILPFYENHDIPLLHVLTDNSHLGQNLQFMPSNKGIFDLIKITRINCFILVLLSHFGHLVTACSSYGFRKKKYLSFLESEFFFFGIINLQITN